MMPLSHWSFAPNPAPVSCPRHTHHCRGRHRASPDGQERGGDGLVGPTLLQRLCANTDAGVAVANRSPMGASTSASRRRTAPRHSSQSPESSDTPEEQRFDRLTPPSPRAYSGTRGVALVSLVDRERHGSSPRTAWSFAKRLGKHRSVHTLSPRVSSSWSRMPLPTIGLPTILKSLVGHGFVLRRLPAVRWSKLCGHPLRVGCSAPPPQHGAGRSPKGRGSPGGT